MGEPHAELAGRSIGQAPDFVEIGFANATAPWELDAAIGPNTAAVAYTPAPAFTISQIMKKSRRTFTSAFKAKVVVEALKERNTIQQLAEKFKLHPNQITTWKKEFLENADRAFEGTTNFNAVESEKEKDELFKQIGQLQVEINWLKKKVL